VGPLRLGSRAHVGWSFNEMIVTIVMVGVGEKQLSWAVVLLRARIRGHGIRWNSVDGSS
jgi:hypothetical protein